MNKTGVLFSKKHFLFLGGREGRGFWVQGTMGSGLGGLIKTGLKGVLFGGLRLAGSRLPETCLLVW